MLAVLSYILFLSPSIILLQCIADLAGQLHRYNWYQFDLQFWICAESAQDHVGVNVVRPMGSFAACYYLSSKEIAHPMGCSQLSITTSLFGKQNCQVAVQSQEEHSNGWPASPCPVQLPILSSQWCWFTTAYRKIQSCVSKHLLSFPASIQCSLKHRMVSLHSAHHSYSGWYCADCNEISQGWAWETNWGGCTNWQKCFKITKQRSTCHGEMQQRTPLPSA